MKLNGARADKYCQSPPGDSLGALLFGPDRGLARDRALILAGKFVADPDDAFNVTILTADDLSKDTARLADEMSAMSLLGDSRLIRVRLDHEKQGLAIGKLIKEFDANPGRCAAKLIVEAGDLTPRSHIRKAFEAAANFAALPCYTISGLNLDNMIRDTLSDIGNHGIGIEKDALAVWAPLLEGDSGLAKSEIEKMALYKGYGAEAGARITLEDIDLLAAGGQAGNLDEIIYAAFAGRAAEADDAFRRAMSGKMHSAVILRSLQRHLTRLHEAIANMQSGQSASDAMRALRPPVFGMRQRDFESQLRLWSIPILDKILNESLETEMRLKTAGSPDEALTGRLLNAISLTAAKTQAIRKEIDMDEGFWDLWRQVRQDFPLALNFGLRILAALTILIVGILLARWIRRRLRKSKLGGELVDATLRPVLASAIFYIIIAMTIYAFLEKLGVSPSALLAIFGSAGLAIGLALKDTLGNIASGIMLLMLRPVKLANISIRRIFQERFKKLAYLLRT